MVRLGSFRLVISLSYSPAHKDQKSGLFPGFVYTIVAVEISCKDNSILNAKLVSATDRKSVV